jgi:hypothetical protein
MFNVKVLKRVLVILLFEGFKRGRVGVLFIDRIVAEDDPDDLQTLLTTAAHPQLDGEIDIPEIVDTSDVLSGPSLGLIAFAAIHVCLSSRVINWIS